VELFFEDDVFCMYNNAIEVMFSHIQQDKKCVCLLTFYFWSQVFWDRQLIKITKLY